MKIKATPNPGKVLVELNATDAGLPLPFELRRILVPLDFSDTARKALQYAVPFASAFGAEILLMHVLPPYTLPLEQGYLPPDLAVSREELTGWARSELEKACVGDIGARARFQVRVCEGVAWQEIGAVARETNTDLIILATRGRTGLKHVLLGSVAERVIRQAPCPVLVVREQERDFVPGATTREPPSPGNPTP
jgi:nucleotide-binding universal stress UspA family protein